MADESAPAQQKTPAEVYQQGVAALAGGRPAEAIASFKAVRDAGLSNGALERALGQAYSKSGEQGLALEHLDYAIRLDRWDRAARQDHAWIQGQVESGFGARLSHPVEWSQRISTYVRWNEILFGASLLLLVAAAMRYFRRERRRGAYALGCLALLGFGLAGFVYTGRSVTVLRGKAPLYSTPLSSSASLMELPGGARIRVLRISGDFTEIERPSSFRGWIETSRLAPNPF
mgnify:CR=1 FL=1